MNFASEAIETAEFVMADSSILATIAHQAEAVANPSEDGGARLANIEALLGSLVQLVGNTAEAVTSVPASSAPTTAVATDDAPAAVETATPLSGVVHSILAFLHHQNPKSGATTPGAPTLPAADSVAAPAGSASSAEHQAEPAGSGTATPAAR